MTIKPEVSTGQINENTGLPEEETTELETTVMLADAQGVAIIPNVLKGGFVVGIRHGRGVVVIRDITHFKELDELCAPETILASDSSGLMVTSIGALTQRQDKVIGMGPVLLQCLFPGLHRVYEEAFRLKDDLQAVMASIKEKKLDYHVDFVNYR